jgi:hypothetical protein
VFRALLSLVKNTTYPLNYLVTHFAFLVASRFSVLDLHPRSDLATYSLSIYCTCILHTYPLITQEGSGSGLGSKDAFSLASGTSSWADEGSMHKTRRDEMR